MYRNIVSVIFIISATLAQGVYAQVDVRKSVLANPDAIEEYRDVVAAMKALPLSDPRSWAYQSGVHMHFDASSMPAGNPYENHSLTPPQHALTNSTWDQCHQSDPDKLFLLWHRVYVYYFEQIARKVSGKTSFSLPYWDYGTELNSRRIPVEFRSPKYKDPKTKKDIENPLYEQRRASVNNGAALDLDTVLPLGLDESDFHEFGLKLEESPHNGVHGALGDSNGLAMGIPNFAAQDPIFWLHHSNIDRLYACWETKNTVPKLVDDGNSYKFINGDGQVVSHSVTEMQQLVNAMNYKYENLADCEKLLPDSAGSPESSTKSFSSLDGSADNDSVITLGSYKTETQLKAEPISIKVKMNNDSQSLLNKSFSLETIQPSKTAAIEIKGFSLKNAPGVSYAVYLKSADANNATMIPIGVMSFFQHLPSSSHHNHTKEKNYYFEVKFLPLELQKSGVEVVFIPTTGVEGDNLISSEAIKRAEPKFKEINLILR